MAVSQSQLPTPVESTEEVSEAEVVDWDDLMAEIAQEMVRSCWDKERGQGYLIQKYGVQSRLQLSDDQLFEFLNFLKAQPKFRVGQTAIFQGAQVVIERFINSVVALVSSVDNSKSRCFEVAMCHLSPSGS